MEAVIGIGLSDGRDLHISSPAFCFVFGLVDARTKGKCKIRAPCCDEVFDCRHCHNDVKNSLDVDPVNRHGILRRLVGKVLCSLCGLSKMFNRTAKAVGFAWAIASDQNASSLMMIYQRVSTTVMDVVYVEERQKKIKLQNRRQRELPLFSMWMLLHQSIERFALVRGESNAPQLPCLF